MSSSQIHSVVFNDKFWTSANARSWLKQHNLIPIKRVHHTENTLRYRIRDPRLFKRFSTKVLPNHINIVLGWI